MCGICGILHFDSEALVAPELLRSMNNTLMHRGPNDEGYYINKHIGLAMRRLSIIDLAGGKQPIHNEERDIWIVFNGEIFNYPELRQRLKHKGHRFYTDSDTETIIHLYEDHGESCVDHLRGMFAFAIWDQRKQSLFLARDRLGIKPLFYSLTSDNRLLFASEPKAILSCKGVDRQIDLQALDAFFTYSYIPAPLTIYKGIRKLLPGHHLRATLSGLTITKYWDLHFQPDYSKPESYFIERFEELFSEAVRIRLLSEVPLGAFLSGGVDSSMVVAHMAQSMSSAPLTFTVGFSGKLGSFLDERPYARILAERYGCRHQEIAVAPQIGSLLDRAVQAFDEPFADDSIIPSYCICESSRQHVTVALTGLGGDELFAGYERYLGFFLSQLWERWSGGTAVTRLLSNWVEKLPEPKGGHPLVDHMKRFMRAAHLQPVERYGHFVSMMPAAKRAALYAPGMSAQIDFDATSRLMGDYFSANNAQDPMDRAFYQDIKTYLPDDILTLTDRIGMFHSQELRVPFTDHKLVEFCATIPASMKLSRLRKKHILKRAARAMIPAEVLSHRKQGFASPMAQWLLHDLRPLREELLSRKHLSSIGLFDPSFVENAVADHLAGRERHDKLLFALIMFMKWRHAYGS